MFEILEASKEAFRHTSAFLFGFLGICILIRLFLEAIGRGSAEGYFAVLRDAFFAVIALIAFIPFVEMILKIPNLVLATIKNRDAVEVVMNPDGVIAAQMLVLFGKTTTLFFWFCELLYHLFMALMITAGAVFIFFGIIFRKYFMLNLFLSMIVIVSLWPILWYFFDSIALSLLNSQDFTGKYVTLAGVEILKVATPVVAMGYFALRPLANVALGAVSGAKSFLTASKAPYVAATGIGRGLGFSDQISQFEGGVKNRLSGAKTLSQNVLPRATSWAAQKATAATQPMFGKRKSDIEQSQKIKSRFKNELKWRNTSDSVKTPEGDLKINKRSTTVPNDSEIYGKTAGQTISKVDSFEFKAKRNLDKSRPSNLDVVKDYKVNDDFIVESAGRPKTIFGKKLNFHPVQLSKEKYGENKWYYPGLVRGGESSVSTSIQPSVAPPVKTQHKSYKSAWGSEVELKHEQTKIPANKALYGDQSGKTIKKLVSIETTVKNRVRHDLPLNLDVFKQPQINPSYLVHSRVKPKPVFTEQMIFSPIKASKKEYGENKWFFPGLLKDADEGQEEVRGEESDVESNTGDE